MGYVLSAMRTIKNINLLHPRLMAKKQYTPKHIGMGSTLHKATRPKELVEMFHQAGHVMSYRDTIRLDAALAGK